MFLVLEYKYSKHILLFADDIDRISDSYRSLQAFHDSSSEWCQKWRLQINAYKTNMAHFRPICIPVTYFNFQSSNIQIVIINNYINLGLCLNEHLDLELIANLLKGLNVPMCLIPQLQTVPHTIE